MWTRAKISVLPSIKFDQHHPPSGLTLQATNKTDTLTLNLGLRKPIAVIADVQHPILGINFNHTLLVDVEHNYNRYTSTCTHSLTP